MSWLLRELAKWRRSKNKPYEHVDVEMSELRNAIGLKWFLGYGDEQLSPEELGAIIGDCLAACPSKTIYVITYTYTDYWEGNANVIRIQ